MKRVANHRPEPAKGFPYKKTGFGARHAHNPIGSKLLRRFAKAKTGLRTSYENAAAQYAALVEPRWRVGESEASKGMDLLVDALRKRQ